MVVPNDPRLSGHEIHNGHLALAVELGCWGLISFYALVFAGLFRKWRDQLGSATPEVRALLVSFLLAAAVFMVHNRLHRDRGFMLLVGLASQVTLASALGRAASHGGQQKGPPWLVYRRVPATPAKLNGPPTKSS